jgi:hypothetical protein
MQRRDVAQLIARCGLEEGSTMKRVAEKWNRRQRRTRMLVLRLDHARRIDRLIDYFGDRLVPVMLRACRPGKV